MEFRESTAEDAFDNLTARYDALRVALATIAAPAAPVGPAEPASREWTIMRLRTELATRRRIAEEALR